MTKNIWPRILPPAVLRDTRRNSEVRVFNRLRDELEDSFHVFYSGPWLAIDQFGNEIDGECDFIVAHRELGVLAIEVKGGGISFDPATGLWRSRDRDRIRHEIKDPVKQARSAKHNILKKLKSSRHWQEKFIGLSHGVIFPDAEHPPRDLGADRPREIFCCEKEFVSGLREWIGRRMHENSDSKPAPLGADGLIALEKLFAQPFNLSFRTSAKMSGDLETLGLLEPSQYQILDHIEEVSRALVQGGAGTGKTVIAIEEAIRSARRGERTLLTCFNTPLGLHFERTLAAEPNIIAASFHSLCLRTAGLAGLAPPGEPKGPDWFGQQLPELLVKAVDKRPDLKWQTIVVDEGQDFNEIWWLAIEAALVPGGKLRVLADNNQKIYEGRRLTASDFNLVPIRLSRNLRNTRRIHEGASRHYTGPPIISEGPEGSEIDWHAVDVAKSHGAEAYNVLRRLVFTEGVNPGDIAVLLPGQAAIDAFRRAAARSEMEFAGADDLSSEHAIVDTVRRFKGLERPAVILVAAESDLSPTELAYIGMTRPRAFLCVVSTKGVQAELKNEDRNLRLG